MSELYKFGYTLDETIKTMRDVIDTGNHDRMFLDTYYWLKMLSEYREIGTVEECREAVEKQKPKKRIYPKTALEKYYHAPECPNCKRELSPQICGYTLPQAIGIYSYCPWCGQNLEGGEEREEE